MMRWMCGVSLKHRKRSVDLYCLLSVQSVGDVVKHGRLPGSIRVDTTVTDGHR